MVCEPSLARGEEERGNCFLRQGSVFYFYGKDGRALPKIMLVGSITAISLGG
jgi:hypothetical protein